jgi:hypothetical protein
VSSTDFTAWASREAGFESFIRRVAEPAPADELPEAGRPVDPARASTGCRRRRRRGLGPLGALIGSQPTGGGPGGSWSPGGGVGAATGGTVGAPGGAGGWSIGATGPGAFGAVGAGGSFVQWK